MATLEKIRSKSVLLVVIIAVALLAFILGDAITNGRNLFGNNTTVAKIGDDKIDIQEYQRRQQELSQQLEQARKQNPQQYGNFDSQLLSQMAIEGLVGEKLQKGAVERLGIQSTPELLRFFLIEQPGNLSPDIQMDLQQIMTALQQSGLPVQSPADVHAIIVKPESYGLSRNQVAPFEQAWYALEAKTNDFIAEAIYAQLFTGSTKANKLDVAALKRDYVAAADLQVAKKPYGNLTDKDYKVTDADIQKAYETQKEKYAIQETTKKISFIAVNIPPSNKDIEKAGVLAATVVKELRSQGGVSKETRKNGLDMQRHDMRLSDVKDPLLKAFLQSAAIGRDSIIRQNGQGFFIAKLNNRSQSIDSLELSTVSVQGNKEVISKVLEYANSGQPMDSISSKFSKDNVTYTESQWIPLYTENGNIKNSLGVRESVIDSLSNSNGAYMVLDEQEGMAILGALKSKKAPKEIVEYESIQYELHPSETTLAEARQKLEKFVAQNNTASKFVKNAKAAGYNPQDLAITPSTPGIPQFGRQLYPDSRSLVRWIVMDGKDGEVSKIYQSKDAASPSLYVAAILDTYEDYIPWKDKDVKEELTAQVRRDKVGDKMVKQYSKNTVQEAAQAMQVEPVTVEKLQSGKRDMTVTDNKVKGRIMGSKPSNKLQVVKGDDGVYAYIITNMAEEPVQMTDDQFNQMVVQMYQVDPSAALRGKKKVTNNVYKFEMGE